MRYNGILMYQTIVDGVLNEYGEPGDAQVSWSEPIPCSIKTNRDNRLGKYEDGEFRQASFIVLIERRYRFAADRIKLERLGTVNYPDSSYVPLVTESGDVVNTEDESPSRVIISPKDYLGEYRVISMEPLSTVGRIQIMV